jgi:DUF917 family protein
MREIGIRELRDLARGAAVLGTGGGGDPYIGRLLAEQAIAQYGPVRLVDVAEVPEDALVLPSAMMGAPTVMVEKLPRGGEAAGALRALETRLGRAATHTVSIEAGGLNSTVPFAVAAELGLPVVDADAMGRAFPELQMVLPTLVGIGATPMALADEKGNSVILDTVDNRWAERLARSATVDMGCTAMISLYALAGGRLEEALVAGTLSLCEELGRLIASERAAHGDPVGAVTERLRGRVLLSGKVVDVERRTVEGFARGEARIEGDGVLGLSFQNEHLLARLDGEVAACTPDLIIVLDAETGEPVTTEGLRYGQRVAALAAPCDPRWRTPAGLALVGPDAFGYDCAYVPVEEVMACAG